MNLPVELFEELTRTETANEFACIVRTPQFKNGQVFSYTVQRGTINKLTWHFKGTEHISGSVGRHDIKFGTEGCFLNCRII